MLWLLMMAAWAGSPCDSATPLADAVDAVDHAWIAATLAPVRSDVSNMQPVLVLKGTADANYRSQQPVIVLRNADFTCARPLIAHSELTLDSLRTGLSRTVSGSGLDAATLADLEVDGWAAYRWNLADTSPLQEPVTIVGSQYTGPTLTRGTRTVQFAAAPPKQGRWIRAVGGVYGKLIVMDWSVHEGDCPTLTHLRVLLRTDDGNVPLGMKTVHSERPLRCISPKAAKSKCVGRWDNSLVNDVHLDGTCAADAVHLADGGMPFCLDVNTCAVVPFQQ